MRRAWVDFANRSKYLAFCGAPIRGETARLDKSSKVTGYQVAIRRKVPRLPAQVAKSQETTRNRASVLGSTPELRVATAPQGGSEQPGKQVGSGPQLCSCPHATHLGT